MPAASSQELSPSSHFRGWRVVAAAFMSQFVANGCVFSVFGVFMVPIAMEFDTSRGVVSTGMGAGMLIMGLAGPLLGRVVDSGPVRSMMLVGLAMMSSGLVLLSRVESLWQAALVFCVAISLGSALFGPLPSTALVSNWFVRRRGLALGLTVSGATVAGLVAPPLAAWLIDGVGWRGAVVAMGIGGAVLAAPLIIAFVVRRPEDIGSIPDGARPTEANLPPPLDPPDTGALLRDPKLWIIAVGFALVFTSPIVMTAHVVAFAEDLGISRQRAAFFFSFVAPFSILGKLLFGLVVDRIDPRHAVWGALAVMAAAWLLLLTEPSANSLMLIGCVFGLGVGAVGPIHGVVVGVCFGRGAIGRVMGIGGLAGLPIIAGSGPLVGLLFDATGGYTAGFALQLVQLAGAALLMFVLKIPEFEPGTGPAPAAGGAPLVRAQAP